MSKALELALIQDRTLIESWDSPWMASLHETSDGRIIYLSAGWDSEVYPNREAAITAQNKWLNYANSDSEEEQEWAAMGQQIVDALTHSWPTP